MLSHARQGLGLGLGLVFGGQVRIRVLSEYLCVFSVPPSDRNKMTFLDTVNRGSAITLSRTSHHYVSLALCNTFLTYGIQISHISPV